MMECSLRNVFYKNNKYVANATVENCVMEAITLLPPLHYFLLSHFATSLLLLFVKNALQR